MSKLKSKIPVILALLHEAVKLIKPIKEALAEEGGIGFRRKMRQFAVEATEAISKNAKAVEELTKSTEEELAELRKVIEQVKKDKNTPES